MFKTIKPGELGYDGAGHPDGAAAKAAGYSFECFYLGTSWKCPSPDELRGKMDAGIALLALAESNGKEHLDGPARGATFAEEYVNYAREIEYPAGLAIVYCNDTSAWNDSSLPFLSVVSSEFHRAGFAFGLYGDARSVKACQDNFISLEVIIDPLAKWAGDAPDAHILQNARSKIGDVNIDVDECVREFRCWFNPTNIPPRKDYPVEFIAINTDTGAQALVNYGDSSVSMWGARAECFVNVELPRVEVNDVEYNDLAATSWRAKK